MKILSVCKFLPGKFFFDANKHKKSLWFENRGSQVKKIMRMLNLFIVIIY